MNKYRFYIICGVFFSSLLSAPIVFARGSGSGGFSFNLGLFYSKQETHSKDSLNGSSDSTGDRTTYDLNLGYLIDNGIYVGLLNSTTTCNNSFPGTGTHQGASLGYHFNESAFFHAHYILSASIAGSYSKGSGYQADLGYTLTFSGKAHVGTMLSYRSITYKEYASGYTGTLISYNTTELVPMFILGFDF